MRISKRPLIFRRSSVKSCRSVLNILKNRQAFQICTQPQVQFFSSGAPPKSGGVQIVITMCRSTKFIQIRPHALESFTDRRTGLWGRLSVLRRSLP